MGRKPTRWTNLPKGMRARPRGNLVHYYLDTGAKPRKEIPLGSDYIEAVRKWAELTSKPAPAAVTVPPTFVDALDGHGKVAGYRADVMPGKSVRSRDDNEDQLAWLLKFFGDPPAPLDSIEPLHIRQYMRWRVKQAKAAAEAKNELRIRAGREPIPVPANLGHVRANREVALFSHVWNYSRGEGLTKQSNPCTGIERFEEEGRDVAPDAALLGQVLNVADRPLQFALRLADIIGQRPQDVHAMSEKHISGPIPGGYLAFKQGKTGAKLRIVIEGALADLLAEMIAYKKERLAQAQADAIRRKQATGKVYPLALLVNEKGEALGRDALRDRFDKAREAAGVAKADFQLRDLRAKAATETDDAAGVRAAQALLGHTTEGMTVDYIRRKSGKVVRPIR